MKTNRLLQFGVLGLGVALLVSVVLTFVSYYGHSVCESDHELARIGLEDVARRVTIAVNNLDIVTNMNNRAMLSKVNTFAQLIAEKPDILKPENRAQFDALAKDLAVDELHVTDGKGCFIRTMPALYEGWKLSEGGEQTAPFMEGLTNANFELVQAPQKKGLATGTGIDNVLFQYAGVARRDAPGIVQIGYRATHLEEALALADINQIAATTRIGRHGRVVIRRLLPTELESANGNHQIEFDDQGNAIDVIDSDCEGYCIQVRMPERFAFWGRPQVCSFMCVLDLLLLILLGLAAPEFRRALVQNVRDLRDQLRIQGLKAQSFRSLVFSPISLGSTGLFIVVLLILWVIGSRQSLHDSQEQLHSAACDIVGEIDNCIDDPLSFIAQEICRYYKNPGAMREVDLSQLKKRYSIDEINVVNGEGICIASTVPSILGQDEWSRPNPAKFCQALLKDGKEVFSQPFRESATERDVFRKYVGAAFPPPAKGYLQVGFERSRLKDSIDYNLRTMAEGWHIGETGFYIIAKTSNGEILSSERNGLQGKTLAEIGLDVYKEKGNENQEERDPVSREFKGFSDIHFFEANLNGEKCLCTMGTVNHFHRYIAAIPLREVYESAYKLVITTAILLFFIFTLVASFVTKQLALVKQLRGFIASEKARRDRDLALARTIQESSLALNFPKLPEFEIMARMDTAREVGGDFYDFDFISATQVMVLIADVSGKGIPAALFMMRAKAILRAAIHEAKSLSEAIAQTNQTLAEQNDAEMFVTAWIGVYDRTTGEVEYVNAGHNPPLVRHADGSTEWIRGHGGLVLAAMPDVKYRSTKLTLKPGDQLFLYTDGVTEAVNGAIEQYGEARLEQAVKAGGEDLVQAVRDDLSAFVGAAEPFDDVTLLSLKMKDYLKLK